VFADRDKNDARIDNEAKDNKKNTTQQEQQKSTERQKVSKMFRDSTRQHFSILHFLFHIKKNPSRLALP
jgi:hypothetical protein